MPFNQNSCSHVFSKLAALEILENSIGEITVVVHLSSSLFRVVFPENTCGNFSHYRVSHENFLVDFAFNTAYTSHLVDFTKSSDLDVRWGSEYTSDYTKGPLILPWSLLLAS